MSELPEKNGDDSRRWYEGITRYQWLVLLIASLGWIFDVFEGQIFVASMREAMPSLLEQQVDRAQMTEEQWNGLNGFWNNTALASFLFGGAVGGVLFGALSDRIGRTTTMILTILVYSLFTCVTAFAQSPWQMVALRFLVAMGVGGEWAVACAMVAEVFPERARARMGSIFHASSVFGTYLAILTGAFVIGNESLQEYARSIGQPSLPWRVGFALGAFPALLTLWIRWRLREPKKWEQARETARTDPTQATGRILDLFSPSLIRSTAVGVSLAAIGLATFWGSHIYGKDVMRAEAQRQFLEDANLTLNAEKDVKAAALAPHQVSLKRIEMTGMFLVTTGGGLGLLAFGPLCDWLGRRGAFLFFHLGGLISALVLYQGIGGGTLPVVSSLGIASSMEMLWIALPVFGFLTLGMHAGYAVYFPELYPTRMRGTGAGFCFNIGRILAAPILFLSGWMQKDWGYSLPDAASLLSLLFLLGVLVLLAAPETKGRDLPQ